MSNLKIYKATEVTLIAVGVLIDSGFADGEFCKLEMADEAFKTYVCTDGEIVFSDTNNLLAKLTVMLSQSSDSNSRLSAIHELDKRTPGGKGVAPWMLRDRQGTSIYQGRFSRITKAPDVSFAREVQPREWQFAVILDERLDGSN
jgi:hypothetical protein